jgi:hypothetical protein
MHENFSIMDEMNDIDEETAKNKIDTKPNIFSPMKLIAKIMFQFLTSPHKSPSTSS